MLIFTENITGRKKYAIETFCALAGVNEVKITSDKNEFLSFHGPRINYSKENFYTEKWIIPSGLLDENGIKNSAVDEGEWEGCFCFFKTGQGDFPFDIFSAAFYLLSRYEEYLPYEADNHSRYSGKFSLLFRNKSLLRPVVDIWAKNFAIKTGGKYSSEVKTILTIDVDNAFAFAHKSVPRAIGGAARNMLKGGFSLVPDRVKVMRGKGKDPYDTYDYIRETAAKNKIDLRFFILLGDPKGNDTNMSHLNKGLREKVKQISNHAECGIHPSYHSFLNTEKVKDEIKRLEDIIGKKVTSSRQHFLRMRLPESYRVLTDAGITDDYTMGFADEPGYRAGTSKPFYWYDLGKEKATLLKVHPFVMMDGTLKRYLGLSPENSIEYSKKIFHQLQETGGVFTLLWHNESVNDYWKWKGWKKVFEAQMAMK